jgi:catechol 2,3-dioxygenase-like lactoylglutathione lyase family enzyme
VSLELSKPACDIGLVVRHGKRALEFYCDVLGMELEHEVPLPGGGSMYRLLCGETVFKVMAPGHDLADKPADSSAPPFPTVEELVGGCTRAPGYCYVALTIGNIAEVYRACLANGHRIVFELAPTRPGTQLAVVADPDGNWIELVQHDDPELARFDLASKDVQASG